MQDGFFSRPKSIDDWFKFPAVIFVMASCLIAIGSIFATLISLFFVEISDLMSACLWVAPALILSLPAYFAFSALKNGKMQKSFLWSLPPLILTALASLQTL